MAPGDTFSIYFDNPHLSPEVAWSPAGFLIRFNTGQGPVFPDHPTSIASERFGFFAGTSTYGFPGLFGTNWAVADAVGNTDAGVDVSTTASGGAAAIYARNRRNLLHAVEATLRWGIAVLAFWKSSSAGAGPIDTVEIALYGNGSGNGLVGAAMQSTGEREFYFNDLNVESAGNTIVRPGDYNNNGIVDAADYPVWRKNEGTSNALPNDPIGGQIGQEQYDQWRAHFGQPAGNGSLSDTTVPEPANGVLLLCAVVGIWKRCRVASRVLLTR